MKPQSGRTIPLYFKVSPEELAVIHEKMSLMGTKNKRAYLRKMAVDGYVVKLDMSSMTELVTLLRRVSSNVNQLARRANETRSIYAEDMEDVRKGYAAIWDGIYALMNKFESL